MSKLEELLIKNRLNNRRSFTVYLNCGDPSIEMTAELINICCAQGVDVIELGVPFANSFTDGGTVLRSHERALKNQVTFEDTIEMVRALRLECATPIVLLADFSHTVKSRGITHIVEQCSRSGIEGVLLHGLPPLYQEEYIKQCRNFGVDSILSLYPNTSPEKMAKTLENARGFVYLVSQYGRNGTPIDFNSAEIRNFYSTVRQATELPLMAGFGIKNLDDMEIIFSTSEIDGVIMGSAISQIIEQALPFNRQIVKNITDYLDVITSVRKITTKKKFTSEVNNAYAS